MTNKINQNRRRLLTQIGTGIAGLGALGVVSADDRQTEDMPTLDQRVFRAYSANGQEGVEKVLEESDYQFKTSSSSKEHESDDGSDASTAARYSRGSTELTTTVVDDPANDDRIRVQVIANLDGIEIRPRREGFGTWAEDVIAITYDEDEWTNVGESSLRVAPRRGASIQLIGSSIDGGGIAASVDLDTLYYYSGQNILLAQSLRNVEGNPGTVYGSYVHSWSGNPSSVSVDSVSGGAGPVSVVFDGLLGNQWEVVDDESTDEFIAN